MQDHSASRIPTRRAHLWLMVAMSLTAALPCKAGLTRLGPTEGVIATAINSDPDRVPTLRVWMYSEEILFVQATFPNVAGARFDAAVYESYQAQMTGFQSVDVTGQDTLQIRHRYLRHPNVIHVMTVTARPGEVELIGGLELDETAAPGEPDPPEELWAPDLCFQLRYAKAFQAYPPEIPRNSREHADQYHDYTKRCFIFTDRGRAFLDQTVRNEFASSVGWNQDDPRNNPPITQRYLGAWQDKHPEWMKYVSPDRYALPILGTVSRDGNHLMAVAGVSPAYMQQALFECLHCYARWLPEDVPVLERTWRRKIYAMENDADAMRATYDRDFGESSQTRRPTDE